MGGYWVLLLWVFLPFLCIISRGRRLPPEKMLGQTDFLLMSLRVLGF